MKFIQNVLKVLFGREHLSKKRKENPRHFSGKNVKKTLFRWLFNTEIKLKKYKAWHLWS